MLTTLQVHASINIFCWSAYGLLLPILLPLSWWIHKPWHSRKPTHRSTHLFEPGVGTFTALWGLHRENDMFQPTWMDNRTSNIHGTFTPSFLSWHWHCYISCINTQSIVDTLSSTTLPDTPRDKVQVPSGWSGSWTVGRLVSQLVAWSASQPLLPSTEDLMPQDNSGLPTMLPTILPSPTTLP